MSAGRIDGLDGIRALAVFLVILIHAGLAGCGWIGVQIFFVLSGFLITRILIEQKQRAPGAARYFGVFYLRRTLRIFPAYFGYLILLAIGIRAFDAEFWPTLRGMLPFLFSYTYNIGLLFVEPPRTVWIAHLWSLCVEEQFYLLWPLLIWLVPARHFGRLVALVVLAGPLLRAALWAWARTLPELPVTRANLIYVLTPAHLDAFAAGAALCLPKVRECASKLPGWAFAALTLAAIACGLLVSRGGLPLTLGFPVMLPLHGEWLWGYSVINVLAAILIAKVAFGNFAAVLFRQRAVNAFGRVSYGIYLIHFGLMLPFAIVGHRIAERLGWSAHGLVLAWLPLYLAVVFGLAWLSFRYFEMPFLRLKDRPLARPA